MQFFVKMTMPEDAGGDGEVMSPRKLFATAWTRIHESGKVVSSGLFEDSPGGFLLMDMDSPDDLQQMADPAILDVVDLESHPVSSSEEFIALFKDMMTS